MFVFKQFAKVSKESKKKGSTKDMLKIDGVDGKNKVKVSMKRIQSLKQVFKGLGLSSKNVVAQSGLKHLDKNAQDDEVDDAICAQILKEHGLAEECSDDRTSFTSLDSVSDEENDNSVPMIDKGKLTDEEFGNIMKVLAA